jgi:hypothetical protein
MISHFLCFTDIIVGRSDETPLYCGEGDLMKPHYIVGWDLMKPYYIVGREI